MRPADPDDSPRALHEGLARLRRRWFLLAWSRVAQRWALATLAVMAAVATVRLVTGATGVPWLLAVVAGAIVSLGALPAFAWPWRHRPAVRRVARYAEEHVPELEERLLSAAAVLESPPAVWTTMERLVVSEGARAMAALDLDRVLPRRVVARSVGLAGVAVVGVLLALTVGRAPLARAWQTARGLLWPGSIRLIVEPGDADVVEDSELALRVRIEGIDAATWDAPVELRSAAPHLREVAALTRAGGTWTAQVPAGTTPFFYRVVTGRLVSPEFHVEVRRRPRVERIALRYDYPSFSGLTPRTEEDGGDVFAPAGTRVTVQVHTRDPIGSGAIALAGQGPVTLQAKAERLLEGQFVVSRDDAYRVRLTDPRGLTVEGDTEYFVRPMDDRPPEVRVIRPGGDSRVTRLEEVTIEARADDDFGIARLDLVYAPRGGEPRVVPLGAGGTSVTGRHTIYVEDLDVRPGDFVTYYVRARDIGRGKRPSETRSDIFFLEIRPFNEEFEAAASQAGMEGGEGSFDDLARLQKDIIVATWRLDRRAGAGKSAQDIRVVARSQAEVKARAERLARQLAPRAVPMPRVQLPPLPPGPQPRPQQAPPPPSPAENPMSRAVEAMTRAHRELDALETGRALPHENEALNEILRAQAEVRRRQVARQQSRGGRGGGQSGNQDLSALFDRELQRQQETNYEQRSPAQSPASNQARREDEQLRRLRELAARQDELARRQQELARRRAQLSGEEVKRRLERLSREQEQLRQQAEALARQMQQRGDDQSADGQPRGGASQQQASSRTSSGGESGESRSGGTTPGEQARQADGAGSRSPVDDDARRLREAAQEMAGAAGDLQRESPDAASLRATRALDRLRAAERAMAGDAPDGRRRRAGDLQAEARELAEGSRRLAAGAGSSSDAESLERVGEQQARLGERAEALERGVREMAGRESSGAAGDAMRRAARELASARVGQRLRQGADAAHQGAAGQRDAGQAARDAAASARSAAESLERLADRLADASGQDGEAQRLADALARTRALRERLAELERQAGTQPGEAGTQPGQAAARRGGDNRQTPGSTGDRASAGANTGAPGDQASRGRDPSGQEGQGASGGGDGSVAGLRDGLVRELRRQQDVMDALRRGDRDLARAVSSLEGWTPSRSAPGTEAWKQDFARWDVLRQQIALAIERHETQLATRLAEREARDRLDAGADDRPGEAWRRDVAEYFKAISARTPRP